MDGDGHIDVAELAPNGVRVLRGEAGGTFGAPTDYWSPDIHYPYSLALGDLDGDGAVDLALGSEDNGASEPGSVALFLNDGHGTFADPVGAAIGFGATALAVADINGDHEMDLVVATRADDRVRIYFNRGHGTFSAPVSYLAGRQPVAMSVADLDGDNKPDLAIAAADATVSVLLNKGDGTFLARKQFSTGEVAETIAAGDLDGNQRADLVVPCYAAGVFNVLLNHGDGTFADPLSYAAGTTPMGPAFGDFDGDGLDDLAITNRDDMTVTIIRNTSH